MKCNLAGGKGTDLNYQKLFQTNDKSFNKPIILRIMKHYSKFGFKDFIIAVI